MIKCDKCDGTGTLPVYHYYKDGICFKCDGTGKIPEWKAYGNSGLSMIQRIERLHNYKDFVPFVKVNVNKCGGCGKELPEGVFECEDCAAEWKDYLDASMDELSMSIGL